jgi:hypothetical protein
MNQRIPFLQKGGDKLLFLHFKIQLYIRPLAKVEFTPLSPSSLKLRLIRGETNSLPLLRGGLGWGALYFCKRSIKLNGIPVEPPERGQPDKGELSCVY